MEILAVIPARGGSKGLPGKNIRSLAGHPLIAYSIEAAKQSSKTNRIICSTDSDEIAAIARDYGAETPFLRPAELAGDHSTDLEAFSHLLDWLKVHEGYVPDIIVQLRPTSPLRPIGFVDQGIEKILADTRIDSIRTVCPTPNTPFKMWTVDSERDRLVPLLTIEGVEEPYNAPRQILPEVWWQNGLLDIMRRPLITDGQTMSGGEISFLQVDQRYAVDIDGLADFELAERRITELECVRP